MYESPGIEIFWWEEARPLTPPASPPGSVYGWVPGGYLRTQAAQASSGWVSGDLWVD